MQYLDQKSIVARVDALGKSEQDREQEVQLLLCSALKIVTDHGTIDPVLAIVAAFKRGTGDKAVNALDGASVVAWITKHAQAVAIVSGAVPSQFKFRARGGRVRAKAKMDWSKIEADSWLGYAPVKGKKDKPKSAYTREKCLDQIITAVLAGTKKGVVKPEVRDIAKLMQEAQRRIEGKLAIGVQPEQIEHDAKQSQDAKQSTKPTEHADEEKGDIAEQLASQVENTDLAKNTPPKVESETEIDSIEDIVEQQKSKAA